MTVREQKVFDVIKAFQREHGEYPTYREIQDFLRVKSINSVTQFVKQLCRKGYLEMLKNRGFRLPAAERPALVTVPLLGSIQAGTPNFTQETAEMVALPEGMVSSPQRSFVLKVRGSSMENAGIAEGDLVIVDAGKKAKEGDVVAALVEEETTVKRLMKKGNGWYLKAESAHHKDITPTRSLNIQGVVTGLFRQY